VQAETDQNPAYLGYAQILTGTRDFGKCKTIGFTDNGILLAVVVYNAHDESNIGISIATTTPKWCTKLVLKTIFRFPFIQLGLNRVTATINENNLKSRSLVERLGFILEGELKHYYQTGESAMIYGLLKDDCRWIK